MQNPSNIAQTIEQLRQHMTQQTVQFTRKSADLASIGTEKTHVEEVLETKEAEQKQKEGEISKLKIEIQQLKSKLPELERKHRDLATDVTKIRLEQMKNNTALADLQRESATVASKSSAKKIGK